MCQVWKWREGLLKEERQEEERLATEEAPKGGVEETKIEFELDQHCKKKQGLSGLCTGFSGGAGYRGSYLEAT